MAKFVIKETSTGFRFELKAGNGENIATSEVYETKAACLKGIESIRACCMGGVEDLTAKNGSSVAHPKFQIYADKKGRFRFRLKAKNGKIIAVSEGYTTVDSCENGIASIKKNAPDALLEEM